MSLFSQFILSAVIVLCSFDASFSQETGGELRAIFCVQRRSELNALVRDERFSFSPALQTCTTRDLAALAKWIRSSDETLRRVDEGLRVCREESEALKLQNNSAWRDYNRITVDMMRQRKALAREKASANAKITDCVLSGSAKIGR